MRMFFDMDGTIADLYSVDNWLGLLQAENASPYEDAKPLGDIAKLRNLIELLQSQGVRFGVISWGAKYSSARYLREVERAKRQWLAKYLPTVVDVYVVDYGTPKSLLCRNITKDDILFDDEARNCSEWANAGGQAIPANNFEDIVKTLADFLTECYD